jgi:ABC-2 type transport system ATP-binding protein
MSHPMLDRWLCRRPATGPNVEVMEEPRTAVRIENLHHRYGSLTAVDHIDLTIQAGTTVAMLGPNGAGKSTTMNLLLGLLPAQQGTLRVFDEAPEEAVARGLIGAMLQETKLVPHLKVVELLSFVRGLYPDPLPLNEICELAGLAEIRKQRLERLSGGQAQRVKFAIALAGRPRLLILDEPTAAMDVASRQAFWRIIHDYADERHTVLFSTHFLEEADRHSDRIVVISAGRVVADGTPAALRGTIDRRVVSVSRSRELDWDRLPGVTAVALSAGRVSLTTADADATVTALADARALSDLELSGPDLEEAFLAITAADGAPADADATTDHLPTLETARSTR